MAETGIDSKAEAWRHRRDEKAGLKTEVQERGDQCRTWAQRNGKAQIWAQPDLNTRIHGKAATIVQGSVWAQHPEHRERQKGGCTDVGDLRS